MTQFVNWTTEFFAWADENHISVEKLPRNAETLLSQTALNLSFCKLTQLPESLANLTHLTELDLAYNELTELPEWIDNFTALEKMDVSGNSIMSLPDSLRHLPNLEIKGLDKQIEYSERKKMALSPMPLSRKFLDELLVWLNLHQIHSAEGLPYNRKTLWNEEVLIANRNISNVIISSPNSINIPESIGNLINLKVLSLANTQITSLPESIGNLIGLQKLDVSRNRLVRLPESIGNLTNLTLLNVANNQLVGIPQSIEKLTKLQFLNLSKNQLKIIPNFIANLSNLTLLGVANNQLTDIPAFISHLTKLEKLDLSNNDLTTIPDLARNMPSLEIMGLEQLTQLKTNMNIYQQKILFGSPGTGKSYKIDKEIIPFDLNIDIEKTPANVIKTVFHPEYTYGDFVGKLMPITVGGNVQYKFYEGHFLKALSQAYKNIIAAQNNNGDAENVVLVIDEINRGNSAAIFGTIFQLLDRNPDGWSSYEVSVNEITFNRLFELCDLKPHSIVEKEIKTYKFGKEEIEAKMFQTKLDFIGCHFENRTIKIPPNLSILASMNTSDSSIYYMDSAFKRRWEWEFIDVDSNTVSAEGVAFETRDEWIEFVSKLNAFIKSNHKSIRGIEDKQIGHFFISDEQILKSSIQNKLMFFLWDSVFNRDKKPLVKLLFDENTENELITFGDFAKEVKLFIDKINER